MKKRTEVAMGNLYDLNKGLVKQFKEVNTLELAAAQQRVKDWMFGKTGTNKNQYFIFICRERYDYTLISALNIQEEKERKISKSCQEVITCAGNRGKIVDICKDENSTAYEFWIKTEDSKKDEDVCLYLLIPYNIGVIEVE